MPAPFDFPSLPTGLPVATTGVSTGGDATASKSGSATGTNDFASLLSEALTDQAAAPQTGPAQETAPKPATTGLPVAPPVTDAGVALVTAMASQPPVTPVSATLLQVQAPAADTAPAAAAAVRPETALETVIAPQDSAPVPVIQAPVPQPVAAEVTVALRPAGTPSSETLPEMPLQAPPVDAPVASAPVVEASVAVASAPAEPVMPAVVMAEAPAEAAPVITTPTLKTTEAKPAKSKPVDAESSKTVQTDESPAVTPDASSLAIVASVATPVTPPAGQPDSPLVVAGSPESSHNSAPAPTGRQTPVAPQAPAPQNQADAADEGTDAPTDNTQTSAKPKFASLLNAAPATAPAANASAAPTSQAPVTPTAAAVPSAPAASAPVQADASQTAPAGEAATTQKPAAQTAPIQNTPVQSAPVRAQTPASQAQAAQSTRKPVSAPVEATTEAASPSAAAAPSGFSLVSTPAASDATGYTPAATQATPATSLLSQTAVNNINALSVQINRRHAEGATKFTMELHPADLGKVDVALSIGRDGKMTAHMTFDSEMTAASFSAHESELRQQLRDTGLQLSDDALSFSTRQKTDAVAQAQAHTVNANARSADDSSSGNSGQQQPQNAFTQADSQQGQHRPHSQHLAQMARSQAAADQAAADADLEALNNAVDLAAARLNYRQSSSRLALDLSV